MISREFLRADARFRDPLPRIMPRDTDEGARPFPRPRSRPRPRPLPRSPVKANPQMPPAQTTN